MLVLYFILSLCLFCKPASLPFASCFTLMLFYCAMNGKYPAKIHRFDYFVSRIRTFYVRNAHKSNQKIHVYLFLCLQTKQNSIMIDTNNTRNFQYISSRT